jgi:glycosyltransferase involved in cell wall biosynthesis
MSAVIAQQGPQGIVEDRARISSLFLFHTPSNVGYAIGLAEALFFQIGLEMAGGDASLVHCGFRSLEGGRPRSLPNDFKNIIACDYINQNRGNVQLLAEYVKQNRIDLVVMYDAQPTGPLFKALREAGARAIISYWGATISSMMPGWKLALKKLELALSRSKVDGLIFQSQAMADFGLYGRGVPSHMIDIVYTGPDLTVFKPERSDYVYEAMDWPRDRKVFVYSGHMEPRKGVKTLIEAAIELLHGRQRSDACFLLCGNKGDESLPYERMYAGLGIDRLIKFGGYRTDMPKIYASCFCGVIPSSGWDSFPRSPLEMGASGLPVIASGLGGLPEAVQDGRTGLLFRPGITAELVSCIEKLLDNPDLASKYGAQGRQRCEKELNVENQKRRLREVFLRRLGLPVPPDSTRPKAENEVLGRAGSF